MAFVPLAVPPGIFRQGTAYQAKGRVYDGNLIRWYGETFGPIGGWRIRGTAVSGKARATYNWKDNSEGRWGAVGTHTKLYAISAGPANFDITPSDFVPGTADADIHTGFGYSTFGSGAFGTARPDTGSVTPATVWDLDNFGQYLVGVAACDGRLLEWKLNTASDAAAVTNAPTSCTGLFVSAESALVALGSGGNRRLVQWSDLQDETVWSPSSTNKAGDFELATVGEILLGRKMPDQHIILTDLDAWSMSYVGDVFVYGFRKVGDGCGGISKKCCVVVSQQAIWWGDQGFWIYDGAVRPLRCDVLNYVQDRLNNSQRSKITSFHNVKNGEVWWFYASNSGNENDSYVAWDYRKDVWLIGAINRTCAVEAGVFSLPIAYDDSGQGHEHEVASYYGGDSPYASLGPFEIGQGDRISRVTQLIADEVTQGLATISFKNRFYPNGAQTTVSGVVPDSSGMTDLRFSTRQLEMVVTFSNDNSARWGSPRLDVQPGGRR